ncbi:MULTISPECIES: AAA family ATPase [unclassified Actinoplanes]|uniref:AAA family ATPase n=1 Tax=unclassified Actinoplanes TaxID=2626549 RepID=UPI001E4FD951|nr:MULTISPECIES: AAA family ATPase [unclassified Actinoplanes]
MHQAGVLHRDITPANLVIPDLGRPVLVDFDLAVLLDDGAAGVPPPEEPLGTLGFLPPEQTGRLRLPVDRRSDLYSFGATLYALATGIPPFPGDEPLESVRDILTRTPAFPGDRDPRIPRQLGAIIMRLLEKNPDRRYQSAEALGHDLRRLTADPDTGWLLGERDFPAVLSGPAQLVGRDDDMRRLDTALERVLSGGGPAVLVAGPPGVGKTSLVAGLRPRVTARGGWFAAGKYDQFRAGTGTGGIGRALAAVAGLLLAEPEPAMAADRKLLTATLGPNTATVVTAVPELAPLLGPPAETFSYDPGTASSRISAGIIGLLRVVAGRRPIVLAIDDLQWASSSQMRVLDAIISAGPIPGLLVVGTYRDQQMDAGHPLTPLMTRWAAQGLTSPTLRLGGLAPHSLADLVGAVLRMTPATALDLAELVSAGTRGNPYATVEMLNALRAEGLLTLGATGWRWDPAEVRGFIARYQVPDLLATRIGQQPEPTRRVLGALACLGGNARPTLLGAALQMPESTLARHLAAATADRMITMDPAGTVRFRHDLIMQAARDGMSAAERADLQLDMARQLAGREDCRREAAEQYLAATDRITTPRERAVAARLLHEAGRHCAGLTNFTAAEQLFGCAESLTANRQGDQCLRDVIAVDRHAALYCLGRLSDADDVYHDLVGRSPDLLTLARAAVNQINSLTQRGSITEAIELGLAVLRRLEIVPPGDLSCSIDAGLERLYRWSAQLGAGPRADAEVETTDPRIVAAGRLINRLLSPTRQSDSPMLYDWLILKAHELWEQYGVCASLVGSLSAVTCVTIGLRDDYRTGYRLTQHIVEVGQRHGYQVETAIARYILLCEAAHWFQPLEDILDVARQAGDELVAAGEVQVASMLANRLVAALLDGSETLQAAEDELTPYLTFAERTGGRLPTFILTGYQQLIRALQGRTAGPGSFADADFDEAGYRSAIGSLGTPRATYHANRALTALLFDDSAALDEHSAAAMADVLPMRGYYVSMLARLTRALSLTARIRAGQHDPALTAELDSVRNWLARRADDCPRNFRPLRHLIDAERAWAYDDAATATREFDAGLSEVSGRPWHRALLAERAGLFHLAQGLRHIGRQLLFEARDAYRAWGADGKVTAMEAAHPFLRATPAPGTGSGPGIAEFPGIDLMAVLRAAQALGSQSTVAGLQARVGEVLSAITGATDAHLVLENPETGQWYASTITGAGADAITGATQVRDPQAATPPDIHTDHRLPLSAIRYVLRTHEPLLVPDACRDDRFARDPYLAGLDICSLLVVPVPSHNVAHAVLVLENRQQPAVFSTDRLETVRLIAGHLAVSLDSAIVHDSLETTVAARTADLAATNRRLADSEQRLRSQFEHAAVGQVIHGPDDRIKEVNPAFRTMIGMPSERLTGRKLTDLVPVPARDEHRCQLSALIADRQSLISHELSLLRADGTQLPTHVTVSAVRDADGRPGHLISIFQDISARRAAEAARDEAHRQLAERHRELEAANQLKADLIGMLGHEINNPLAMILGYVDLGLSDDELTEPVTDLLERIRRSVHRLESIVHEVLALVSIDAGRLTALPQPIRVAEHIDAALSATATAGLPVTCPPDLVAAMQPGHFDHILTNLISNAAKYGGGATAIVAAPSDSGQSVTVAVHDDGPGVPPEFRTHLFERFTRAHRTAGTVSGTGLGLYIVRELARANGGDVNYRPAPGHGSIFELTLPIPATTLLDLVSTPT